METLAAIPAALARPIGYLGALAMLTAESLYWIFISPFRRGKTVSYRPLIAQLARVGFSSIKIVGFTLFCVGLVMALQMARALESFGVAEYVGTVVGASIFRELGPLIAAVVMVGHIGAAFAAELGTMVVREEVEALEAAAISPVRFLVAPRMLAAMLMVPLVTLIGDFLAVLGGLLICAGMVGISADLYFAKVVEPLLLSDLYTGVFKSFVFATLMAAVSCMEGISVTKNAESVGRASKNAVVLSIVAIILSDAVLTITFFELGI